MANFVVGTAVETAQNSVEVTITANTPLKVGVHHFQLVVVDEAGNQSVPATAEVIIRDTQRPTAVLKVLPSSTVEYGKSFTLDGSTSSDVAPGQIVKYIWTLLD